MQQFGTLNPDVKMCNGDDICDNTTVDNIYLRLRQEWEIYTRRLQGQSGNRVVTTGEKLASPGYQHVSSLEHNEAPEKRTSSIEEPGENIANSWTTGERQCKLSYCYIMIQQLPPL